MSIKLAFWQVSKDFLKLSVRKPDAAESASCSSLAPESLFLCLFLPLPLAGEQNWWCAALGGTMGLIHGLGKEELSLSKHWPYFLLGTLQRSAESTLFGFFQPLGRHLNERGNMGLPGSPGSLKQSWDTLTKLMIFVCKQREVIQTAVNFIKKPYFKVPEQAFLFMPGLSPAFIFASTLAGLACVYG